MVEFESVAVITATTYLGWFALSLLPKLGPGRALSIAARSYFNSQTLNCPRKPEENSFYQGHLVVTGGLGVGKSFLVDAATSKTPGVIKITTYSGHSREDIVINALGSLSGMETTFDPIPSARRFWTQEDPNYGLARAVDTLVKDYKLKVVVEGQRKSLYRRWLYKDGRIVLVGPMTKPMIRGLNQHQDLFKIVDSCGLDELVWRVLGGFPVNYDYLWRELKFREEGKDPKEMIEEILCDQISSAISFLRNARFKNYDMEDLSTLYDRKKGYIDFDFLQAKTLKTLDEYGIVLTEERNGMRVLVPASNPIEIVLHHRLKEGPTPSELRAMLNLEKE